MLVSIITTSFNSEDTIEKTIQSVAVQSHPNIEYIIIDGLSTDRTMEIVRKHLGQGNPGLAQCSTSDVQLSKGSEERFISTSVSGRGPVVISERDAGIYDAMNKGVAMATGEVVGILNSDDFYAHEDVISRVVETFAATGCDAVYSDCCYVDRHNTDRIVRHWNSGEYREGAFRNGWMPPHPTFFVRKEHYNRYGAYRAEFRSAGDYEWMLRLVHKHRIQLAYLPGVTVKMRAGGASNRSLISRLRANSEDRQAWRINDLRAAPHTLYFKPLRKIGQFLAGRRNKDVPPDM